MEVTVLTEDQLQALFWKTVWINYPQTRHLMWAVPNDAHVNPIEAARLKAIGLLSGVWDLHLFYKGTLHIIETKIGVNGLTTTRLIKSGSGKERKVFGQKEWGELMATHGAVRHIYRTLDEGLLIIEQIIASGP